MYLLGIDLGSSSVKASILDAVSGLRVAEASSPETELETGDHQEAYLSWEAHLKRSLGQSLGIEAGT